MAGGLKAAILCGALWVCCNSLAPRLKSPATGPVTATGDTPSVTGDAPPVTADMPPVTADTPPATAYTPLVAAYTPIVTADTPLVTADTPLVTADTPPVTADTPPGAANTPPVAAYTPTVTADTPLVTADTPPVTANTPPVTAVTPPVTADTPPVTADTPPATAYTPLVAAYTPTVTADTPLVTTDTPPVTANTPPVAADTPPVTADTPPVTADTPLVTAETPPVTANTPPVTTDTPPVAAYTPSVTAYTPSVTVPVTVYTFPVTDYTPTVTADTFPVTADPDQVTAKTNPVSATMPYRTYSPPPVPPILGTRTSMDGNMIVMEVKADLLPACVAGSPQDTTRRRTTADHLEIYSTSHIRTGILKIDLRSDDVIPTQDTDGVVKSCSIALNLALNDTYSTLTMKVVQFKISPGDQFRVDIIPLMRSAVSYTASIERPEMLVFKREVSMDLEWRVLPKSVTMVIEITTSKDKLADLMEWPVTNTSERQGTIRTPFWDGVTSNQGQYGTDLTSVSVRAPSGDRIMISWEFLGVGDSTTCEPMAVCVTAMDTVNAEFNSASAFCGAAPPAPSLWKWGWFRVSLRTTFNYHQRTTVFTGLIARYSFHSPGLVPRQLAHKTWDCSVAHWPDFSDHFLCDLVTQCAGGEDEADCPYTPRGGTTCRHGYLAAGGSCFTFDLVSPSSWAEARVACWRRGARLPTMNTPAKWRAVLDLLSHRGWDNIYIGLTSADSSLSDLYSDFLQWTDSSVAYYFKAAYMEGTNCDTCAFLKNTRRPGFLYMDSCVRKVPGSLLCEALEEASNPTAIEVATEIKEHPRINSTRCPKGHVTHNFLSCDSHTDCWDDCYTTSSVPHTSLPPAFFCHNGERVPFTLVCDHREDCSDASDEICVFPPCQEFECKNKQSIAHRRKCDETNDCLCTLTLSQCIANKKTCDKTKDCLDGSDEIMCSRSSDPSLILNFSKPLPAMVLHDGKGLYNLLDIADPFAQSTSSGNRSVIEGCPDSHFQCPGVSYYCLPVYVRCNGVYDCPGHQDEADCSNYKCPGLYRCRRSMVCVHSDHVCDGVFHCPLRDDELTCDFVCPVGCTCYGLAFFCTVIFDASRHAGLRFLDASGSGFSLKGLSNNTMLGYLNLARCNVTQLETMNFVNLFHLDLSENSIASLAEKHISQLRNLQVFFIAGNPLRTILEDSSGRSEFFAKFHTLDLSAVTITTAQIVNLHVFANVTNLNLSNTGLDAVSGFSVFSKLRVLDLRGCPVTYFTRSVFKGLDDLSTVYADNYKLCCQVTLPNGFNVLNCHAPVDEVSSCEGLLKSVLYRVGLSILTLVTLLGNAGSFVYRVFINRPKQQSSFGLFVTSLCLSDFLMGVYSAIIGVADRLYLGNYVWNDVTWKTSIPCKIAGVLALLSNEVSVLIICLITVDRFLVIRFPFSLHLHFSPRSARVACVIAWSIGVLLAGTPLLPMTSQWQLYSQTGICIPLPVTRRWFAGRDYSFGILIILNFVLFLVIAGGQMSIYLSIRANSITTSDSPQKAKDLTIARRLITVAVSDFLCWFPVGLLGMLSSRGHPTPGEANVVIAVFVMPLNSALNPFLYTVNVILERRQRAREQRLQKIMLARHGIATARREEEERK